MRAATEERARRTVAIGYSFALSASVAYGASQVLTRHTVTDLAPPLAGAAVALFWGTLAFSGIAARGLSEPGSGLRQGALWFAAAGVFSALGILAMFLAFEREKVVLVAPVLGTNPLFSLLLAAIFLRGVERITLRVVAGALLVVAGVVVLSVA